MTRPVCVHCGAKYGQRELTCETVVWKAGDPKPAYTGNLKVVKERMWHTAPHNVSGSNRGVPFGHNDNVMERDLWDGESWKAKYFRPFCTQRCALSYARKAYRAHQQNTEEP